MRRGLKTIIAIALALPLRLEAQAALQRSDFTSQPDTPSFTLSSQPSGQAVATRSRFWRAAAASSAGSALGLVVGAPLGLTLRNATGCCFEGGDDPGLTEGLIGALAGATVGSALLGWTSDDLRPPHRFGQYVSGAVIGIMPGFALGSLGAWAFDSIDPDLPLVGFVLGFSVGQGTTAALVGTRRP